MNRLGRKAEMSGGRGKLRGRWSDWLRGSAVRWPGRGLDIEEEERFAAVRMLERIVGAGMLES